MILISHRGNITGPIIEAENNPNYIDNAIKAGFDVEIDIWILNNNIWLGHDKNQYEINLKWLEDRFSKLWIHCKNIDAILYFKYLKYPINYFWHEKDTITMTSKGYIWAYPGKQPIKESIAVLPELYKDNISKCIGICSDYIINY